VCAPAAARKFHYSHRVSISGRLVDHWTINDTRSCGPVGDGSVTVEFHQTSPAKARVEYNRVEGRWEALVPGKTLLVGLPAKPVVGTISFVDNTVATGLNCSEPLDKSGCGTYGGLVQVKMPSPRSFKRRHTVTVTGTTHKSSSFGGSDPDEPKITDDVTRTVTVTFTRLS
jgi:hypothetical protein